MYLTKSSSFINGFAFRCDKLKCAKLASLRKHMRLYSKLKLQPNLKIWNKKGLSLVGYKSNRVQSIVNRKSDSFFSVNIWNKLVSSSYSSCSQLGTMDLQQQSSYWEPLVRKYTGMPSATQSFWANQCSVANLTLSFWHRRFKTHSWLNPKHPKPLDICFLWIEWILIF